MQAAPAAPIGAVLPAIRASRPARRGRWLVSVLGVVLAGCSAGPGATGAVPAGSPAAPAVQLPALANVGLDRERVAQAAIGPAGGVIDATDANGATYHLVIPENAILQETVITIAPIETLGGLPDAAAVAAGVHLLPEGQHFAVPATLTITLPSAPAGGVVGFAYRGDMAQRGLYPIEASGSALKLTLFHFSGYAALMATSQAADARSVGLDLVVPLGLEPTTDEALGAIAAALLQVATDPGGAQISGDALLAVWLANEIRPAVQRLLSLTSFDEAFLLESIRAQTNLLALSYVLKLMTISGLPPSDGTELLQTLSELARSAANHAIDIANARCTDPADGLTRATWSVYWQGWAKDLHVDDGSLDFHEVLGRLCLKAVLSPTDGAIFPESLQPGGLGDLRLHLGYTVVDRTDPAAPVEAAPAYDVPFKVSITPTGTIPGDVVRATTDGEGRLAHGFQWVPDEPQLQLLVEGCFDDTIRTSTIQFICVTTTVNRGDEVATGGATAVSHAGTHGEVGCRDWILAHQCTRWSTERPENASQFWLEPKSGNEPGDMAMSASQEFKVDEVRLENGALKSVTISGTFEANVAGGGAATTGAEYSVALRDLGPILKWHGTVSGQVAGVPASDSSYANTLAGTSLTVAIDCGGEAIEYSFEKIAGSSFGATASGSDDPGALVDVAGDSCRASFSVQASATSNRLPAPGQTGSARVTFSITIEVSGTGGGNVPD